MLRTGDLLGGLAFGGDYNPEQWPPEVWPEDVDLMRRAGVTLVTVGVFSWSRLQPTPAAEYDFGWLDDVLGLLHDAGIAVDLATATASPPPWFSLAHPEAALVDASGVRRSHGARQAYCPSAPAFRDAAMQLATAMADRYADHPALRMWHVSNEYACQNYHCFCDASADAFRAWLRDRYGSIDGLNAAWGTSFWSQQYGDWAEVLPPRAVSYDSFANPTQQLDFWRFSSDAHLALFRAERDVLHVRSSAPVTTNFMSFFKPLDYWRWAAEVDFVSNDDYLIVAAPDPDRRTAMSADLMRSLAGQRPWLLMEHSTSAVNWQPRNVPKRPGQLRRNSLQHVARGSDGAMFFQWRASRAGAEKFHSAMLPHGGPDTRIHREVGELGADLGRLADVAGSTVERPNVAIVLDWQSRWAAELDAHPSVDVTPMVPLERWYAALYARGIGVDFAHPEAELSGYRLVVVPVLYSVTDAGVAAVQQAAAAGATVVITYFSGIVDENDHLRPGRYPAAFRELLGIELEEFAPLLAGARTELDNGMTGTVWSDVGRATTATVHARHLSGPAAGSPAITEAPAGRGRAWYVGTELSEPGFAELVDTIVAGAGVTPTVPGLPAGVEAVRRSDGATRWLFVVNHRDEPVTVPVDGENVLHPDDTPGPDGFVVGAGDVLVVSERV